MSTYLEALDRLADAGRKITHYAVTVRDAVAAAGPCPDAKTAETAAGIFGLLATLYGGLAEKLEQGSAGMPWPALPPGFLSEPFKPSSN